jgi:Protein of unknown function (DUF3638)/Protein of unknown function (DUF3645)
MLILEYVQSGENVVRVNMLPSIVAVVAEMYKCILTASVQHIRILTLPYQRNFPLDVIHAQVLSEEMFRSKIGKCCFLVTPQHRNSLLLKQYDEDVFVDGIQEPSVDIMDESDALLHQSYQLVYALGDQEHLPDGRARWTMVEVFLQILARSVCPQIASVRDNPLIVHKEDCGPGAFPRLRLLPSFEEHRVAVGEALCRELIKTPPHDFLWMRRARISVLVDIMSNDQCPASDRIESDPLFLEFKADILAARGCIAFCLLFHCLVARHRVQYGIDLSRGNLAVPFSCSDTPKPRADYSHPDVQLTYTCLAYFHCGLTKEQFKEALSCLQRLGPTAQDNIYNSWINSIRGGTVMSETLIKFDSFRKVDLDNSQQIDLMYRFLRYCMEAVSFWMNNSVFPVETHVFPQRRVTSAWDLVSAKSHHKAVGFSGTVDNSKLSPQTIKPLEHKVQELRATNGVMIDRILKFTNGIYLLADDGGNLWKNVLLKCAAIGAHALIDVGGLMAGTRNADAAVFLSEKLDQALFRGVVYYDTVSDVWAVFNFQSKKHSPLRTSSLAPAECFAFYDESRCRGSDLKLLPTAAALVTLEPGLTKDRFLQGCARMRKLGPGEQKLFLAGTSETLSSSCSVQEVLKMTIRNSAKAIEKGIMELYDRGMNHFKFPQPQDLDVSLTSLYGDPVTKYHSMGAFLDATIEDRESLPHNTTALVEYSRSMGDKASVKASQLAEECERELEEEEEEEEEVEKESEIVSPSEENDWNFAEAFLGRPLGISLTKIKDSPIKQLGIRWSNALFCTSNFLETVTPPGSRQFYLRPVNAFLHCADGSMVLISDYEADKLLPYWWKVQHSSPPVKLGHLALASNKVWLAGDQVDLPALVRASAKLFRGYVNFEEDEKAMFPKLFRQCQPRSSILKVLELRHRVRFLDRSDLDEFSFLELRHRVRFLDSVS